jgi:genome maintenance exonuclease 1
MAQTVIKDGLVNVNEFWGVEVPLYFPKLYAGTTDCVGIHQQSESIIDFKQTNKPKREEWIEDYYLQLTAYALAHNEVHVTYIKKSVINIIDRDAKLQSFVIEGNEFEYYSVEWTKRIDQFYK